MTTSKSLFHAEMVNESGVNGEAYVKNDGLKVKVSSPTSKEPGTNPEELLGLSLSTCLNATIQSVLKARGKSHKSKVEVHVDFMKETSKIGFYFDVIALAQIDGLKFEEAKKLVEVAEQLCPVSKLLMGSHTVVVKTIQT
ncbi:MAG: OsmC family protein [Carnobacterium sp.]|uniref:OsmC family protein n=1 Tax=Carnobacterium sp. TaxID=48221 RepID=UPI003C75DB0C